MSVKNVVKVMNFHSLLRVEKSRRKAAMYFDTERELFKIIKKILFNKNLILDKKAITPKSDAPVLNVYIGNDLGFCGDFNFLINKEVSKDDGHMIIIGKKVHSFDDKNVLLFMSKEDFYQDFSQVEDLIYDGVIGRKYREINVIYNHYYNVNKLEFTKKKLAEINGRLADLKSDLFESKSKKGYARDVNHIQNLLWWIFNNEEEKDSLESELKRKEVSLKEAQDDLKKFLEEE